jgi:dipeptidyl aminopeptidase/acylaminoacyl peptidase
MTFITHATDDPGVPVENSLAFYSALIKQKIPAEMHLYQQGGHGYGMRKDKGEAATWYKPLEIWLAKYKWIYTK